MSFYRNNIAMGSIPQNPVGPIIINNWVSDDFSGGSLDTAKWTSHITTSGTISVASSELQMTRPATNTVNWIDSVTTQNSNIIFAQAYVNWDTNSTQEDLCGIGLTSDTTPRHGYPFYYCAQITSRETGGGQYRIIVTGNASTQYDFDTNINKGTDVKITYDTSNNQIKFFYWNSTVWTQMGTTQTASIIQSGSIKLVNFYDYINTSVGTYHSDNIYFGRIAADYSTHYPS